MFYLQHYIKEWLCVCLTSAMSLSSCRAVVGVAEGELLCCTRSGRLPWLLWFPNPLLSVWPPLLLSSAWETKKEREKRVEKQRKEGIWCWQGHLQENENSKRRRKNKIWAQFDSKIYTRNIIFSIVCVCAHSSPLSSLECHPWSYYRHPPASPLSARHTTHHCSALLACNTHTQKHTQTQLFTKQFCQNYTDKLLARHIFQRHAYLNTNEHWQVQLENTEREGKTKTEGATYMMRGMSLTATVPSCPTVSPSSSLLSESSLEDE